MLSQNIAIFAMIQAFESDLCNFIKAHVPPGTNILSTDQRNRCRFRLDRRNPDKFVENVDDPFLCAGLDFQEKYQVITQNSQYFDKKLIIQIRSLHPYVERLTPIRNDVMHGRPLTFDDYADGFAALQHFAATSEVFATLADTSRRVISNPHELIRLAPEYLDDDDISCFHNLPHPDYDDTGFIGRKKLLSDLLHKLESRHPVITVLGAGGLGKTALVVQAAYELIKKTPPVFDGVIWVSAKASKLVPSEIARIENAITSSGGIFCAIEEVFQSRSEQPLVGILNLLASNKILLIIDNLETILDDNLRTLASDVPGQSKLLLTSRVPLGSDLTIGVEKFSDGEAKQFLAKLIDVYNVDVLRAHGSRWEQYIKRLGNVPLLIKWFVLAVQAGGRPEAIVADPQLALRFCFENVFNALSADARLAARALSLTQAPLSMGELQYLCDLPAERTEAAIVSLTGFSIATMSREPGSDQTVFSIGQLARSFAVRFNVGGSSAGEDIGSRLRRLTGDYQDASTLYELDKYRPATLFQRVRSDGLIARRLREAVRLTRMGMLNEAFELLAECKILAPDYFEVYRVEAFSHFIANDFEAARDCYISALELAPGHAPLRHFYGGLLLRAGDLVGAVQQFEEAVRLDPEAVHPRREMARCLFIAGRFDDARAVLDTVNVGALAVSRERTIHHDLYCQYFIRKAEALVHVQDSVAALVVLQELQRYASTIPGGLVDKSLREHVGRSIRSLDVARARLPSDEFAKYSFLRAWLVEFSQLALAEEKIAIVQPRVETQYIGQIKPTGLQRSFGFLSYGDNEEIFVHISDLMNPSEWPKICSGAQVTFHIASAPKGLKAVRVALAKDGLSA